MSTLIPIATCNTSYLQLPLLMMMMMMMLLLLLLSIVEIVAAAVGDARSSANIF